MPNEEACMPSITLWLALAALAVGADMLGTNPAHAQCSVFSRRPCVPGVNSVFDRHPCVPGVSSVFRRHPCASESPYPFSEDLRLTIVSAASDDKSGDKKSPDTTVGSEAEGTRADAEHRIDTIRDLFDALRSCWVPPSQDEARPGMQMSVRLSFMRSGQMIGPPRVTYTSPDAPPATRDAYHDAIMTALERCTPLRFTPGLGGAVAGRPIAIRYVDNRNAQ
jgi:hypothetical protein